MLGFDVTIRLIPDARGRSFEEVTSGLREAGLLERESPLVGMTTYLRGPALASFTIGISDHSLDDLVSRRVAGMIGTGGYPDRYWTRVGDARTHIRFPDPDHELDGTLPDDERVLIEIWDLS